LRRAPALAVAAAALLLSAAPAATAHPGTRQLSPKAAGLKPGNKAILRAVFAASLPRGSYEVSWRALADDGHHEQGSWTFHVG
jgi:CopC domain-containing protein